MNPNRKYLVLLLCLFSIGKIWGQDKVEIAGGEKLFVDQVKHLTYIVGNVILKHQGVVIQCDSAVRNTDKGIIEGFGHIYIYQPDTFTLTGGKYLLYTEASRTAMVTGDEVHLSDKSMDLKTKSVYYNLNDQMGYYLDRAEIKSGDTDLESKRGFYFRRSGVFRFKENVILNGPDYKMIGDTLDYHSNSGFAWFFGPTRIMNEENTIVCTNGWYNTKTKKAVFTKGAVIHGKNTSISADSLAYDSQVGKGFGRGNVQVLDSGENLTVYGQYATHFRDLNLSTVSGMPVAIQVNEDDTMRILADTFVYISDSINRIMRAYHASQIHSKEVMGNCDSLVYKFSDSAIFFFGEPVLWNGHNQITGDTIFVFLKNKKIDKMLVNGNAFLAGWIKEGHFNQISGLNMINSFKDGDISTVLVSGNASSIYYLRDNETDSAEYSGIFKGTCQEMLILLDSSKVEGIKFYNHPEGKIYPVTEFPMTERALSGLNWMPEKKPQLNHFEERTVFRKKEFELVNPEENQEVRKPKKSRAKKSKGKGP